MCQVSNKHWDKLSENTTCPNGCREQKKVIVFANDYSIEITNNWWSTIDLLVSPSNSERFYIIVDAKNISKVNLEWFLENALDKDTIRQSKRCLNLYSI